ncbi:argininosuccinate lyase [Chlamydiota bacterium]
MKLWEKGYKLDRLVETFMTGDDPVLDRALIPYDCMGSIAHAKMLAKIGILTTDECHQLVCELQLLMRLSEEGRFKIRPEDEDVHTAIENALTVKLGHIGKKIHTARSRNDQILLDLRLYSREWLLKTAQDVLGAIHVLLSFAEAYQAIPIPGRTHFQRAMPSSLGLWAGAFAESLLDDMELLKTAYLFVDQCPLGSAASYGVALDIDRQYVADLLGFEKVQNNVLYANNSRGKFEAVILNALVQIMNDLSKIATDIIIFSAPEFGYLGLPEKFCPGSSLMPQKRNPCPLELIRAKSATLQSYLFQVLEIVRTLPSGYNRDFQETKRPLMQGFEATCLSLKVLSQIIPELEVRQKQCTEAFTSELFATDQVLKLVKEGKPFRDAYSEIAIHPEDVSMQNPIENILSKTHLGATGNLRLDVNRMRLQEYQKWHGALQQKWQHVQTKISS